MNELKIAAQLGLLSQLKHSIAFAFKMTESVKINSNQALFRKVCIFKAFHELDGYLFFVGLALVSACIAAVPAALRLQNEDYWFHLAIVVLVGSCPCALILSTPTTFFCALSRAAKDGLLFKGGGYLEILAKVKTVAFDKTGTVTRGEFVVTSFQSICNDIDLNTLLHW